MRELAADDFVFDGPLGSAGATIERLGPNHFMIRPGHGPEHPEWTNVPNFAIRQGARGNPLRVDVAFDGGWDMAFNSYACSWSYDAETWHPIRWEFGKGNTETYDSLIFPTFEQDTVYVGHQVPMTYEKMVGLLNDFARHPAAEIVEFGRSIEDRPMLRLVVTDPQSQVPLAERPAHYIANQHPCEYSAQWRIIAMIDWLLSGEAAADSFLAAQTAHFVVMMCVDGPSNGWYRVNADGVDMNRSYHPGGSDAAAQTREAFLAQRDLERMAETAPLGTIWSMHTWQGLIEPLIDPAEATETRYGSWEILRDAIEAADPRELIKPLRERPSKFATSWTGGPREQFGVSCILCEGVGLNNTKTDCLDAGRALVQGLAHYRGYNAEGVS